MPLEVLSNGSSSRPRKPGVKERKANRIFILVGLVYATLALNIFAIELPTFPWIVTNFPPVKNLILDVQYMAETPTPTTVQYRYQPGAFYARQLTGPSSSMAYPITPEGTSCGYWGGEFWYLDLSSRYKAVLTTGIDSQNAVKLRQQNPIFEHIFNLFTTYGLSPEGADSVRVEGDKIITKSGRPTWTLLLSISNGLPKTGRIDVGIPGARGMNVAYAYDPKIVQLPIPKEIRVTQLVAKPGFPHDTDLTVNGMEGTYLYLAVKEMVVGDLQTKMDRSLFRPDEKLLGSNYLALIITNGEPYELTDGKLKRANQSVLELQQLTRGGVDLEDAGAQFINQLDEHLVVRQRVRLRIALFAAFVLLPAVLIIWQRMKRKLPDQET